VVFSYTTGATADRHQLSTSNRLNFLLAISGSTRTSVNQLQHNYWLGNNFHTCFVCLTPGFYISACNGLQPLLGVVVLMFITPVAEGSVIYNIPLLTKTFNVFSFFVTNFHQIYCFATLKILK